MERNECENHEYRRSGEQRNQMCADRVIPGCSVTSTLAIFTPKSSPHSANSLHTDWSCWQAGHHGAKLQTCKPFNPITQPQPEETHTEAHLFSLDPFNYNPLARLLSVQGKQWLSISGKRGGEDSDIIY